MYMYNKTIIRFGVCDIQNNQGLGIKGLSLSLSLWLRLISPTSTLIIWIAQKPHPMIVYYFT